MICVVFESIPNCMLYAGTFTYYNVYCWRLILYSHVVIVVFFVSSFSSWSSLWYAFGCPQMRIRPRCCMKSDKTTRCRVYRMGKKRGKVATGTRRYEEIEPVRYTVCVLFALKLHNHKSQEMNIIQMSSDEILMYVMSYIRFECAFFLIRSVSTLLHSSFCFHPSFVCLR